MKTLDRKAERERKRAAVLYCANNGLNFYDYYYGENKPNPSDKRNPNGVIYKSLEELQKNYSKDCTCYHYAKTDEWFYVLSDFYTLKLSFKQLKEKFPELEKYRIERIYRLNGLEGTGQELMNALMISKQKLYKNKNLEIIRFRMVKK